MLASEGGELARPASLTGFIIEIVLGQRYNKGYTTEVKTAVSLPDELFKMAEASARRLQVSRSELYARALAEFLQRDTAAGITQRLNELYSQRSAEVDTALLDTQWRSLKKEEW